MKLRQRQLRQVSLDEPVRMESSFVPRDIGRNDLDLIGVVDRIDLDRAIQELPKGCREIFILHEVEGHEHHEIARLLRCSVGNSKSQLHKARLKMRALLFPQRDEGSTAEQKLERTRRQRAKNGRNNLAAVPECALAVA